MKRKSEACLAELRAREYFRSFSAAVARPGEILPWGVGQLLTTIRAMKDSVLRSALRTLGLALVVFSPLVLVIGWAVYQHFFQPPNEEEFNAKIRRTAEWVLAGQTVCAEFAIVDFDHCATEVERRAKASGQQDSPETLKAVVAVIGASTAQEEFKKVCTEWWTQQSCAGVLADAVALVAQEKLTGLRLKAAANADEARRVQQVLQRNE